MKLNLYSTFDSKAKAWTLPFFMSATDSIERAWTEVVNDPSTQFGKHPEDYTCFQIGEWDALKGEFTLYESKRSIGTGVQFIKSSIPQFQPEILPVTKSGKLKSIKAKYPYKSKTK